jgi:hypothetical protein
LKVWNGEAVARPLLAAPQVDVAEFTVSYEGGDLITGGAEIRRCLIDQQQSGIAGHPVSLARLAGQVLVVGAR